MIIGGGNFHFMGTFHLLERPYCVVIADLILVFFFLLLTVSDRRFFPRNVLYGTLLMVIHVSCLSLTFPSHWFRLIRFPCVCFCVICAISSNVAIRNK